MTRSISQFGLALGAAPAVTVALTLAAPAAAEFAVNGDFETGDTSGWVSFPTANSTFDAITDNPFAGTYAGRIFNDDPASAAVVKQANLGIGDIGPGEELIVSFYGRGSGEAGGVQFAEFFSELDGGGVSKAEILGGAPLFLGEAWDFYTFNVVTGPDVSGGVTLQFTATTGGATGSVAETVIDNVSITRVPEPASAALLGLGVATLALRRRR